MWLFVISLVGYPLAGLFGALLNLDSKVVSIPFRTLTIGLSLWVIAISIGRARWWIAQRWLVLFFALYAVRLLWDFAVPGLDGVVETFGLFVVFTALPMIAVGLGTMGNLPEDATAWRLGLAGACACLLAAAMQTFGWGIAQQVDLFFTGGRLMFTSVDAITLGHAATTTLVCTLCLLRGSSSTRQRVVLAAMAASAGMCLMAAGSRGPVVALAVCVLIYSIVTAHRWWALALSACLVPAVLTTDSDLAQRFGTVAGDDTSSLERLILQANAFQQFVDSPLFGSAYVEKFSGSYPHNLIVETGMAMGTLGLVCLTLMLVTAGISAWKEVRRGRLLVPLLFVQYLVSAQVSGAIWGLQLWLVAAMLVPRQPRQRGTRRRALPDESRLIQAN